MTFVGTAPSCRTEHSTRILLVEDSDTVRLLTTEYLRCCGHVVVDVASAEQALCLLERDTFDLLFTDMSLPGMSGADLIRAVRRTNPSMSIVVSSGFDMAPDVGLSTSGIHFLAKPYDLAALQRVLNDVVVNAG